MKIIKSKMELKELSQLKVVAVNVFYEQNYKMTVGVVENQNIMCVTKEDLKSEYFEREYFEINK